MLDFHVPTDSEAPEFVTVSGIRYLKGRNGKLWRCPPVQYHYRELYEAMSAAFYGRPSLNEHEAEAYEAVLPFLAKVAESAEEQYDDLVDGEPSTFCGGRPSIDIDPESTAYRIAEELIALGWTPPARKQES